MHPQIIRSFTLLGCVSFAAAVNDIVSLVLPNVDQQDLVGEVIGNDGPMTTYIINCPNGADSSDCGIPSEGLTLTANPTTFIFDYTFEDYWLRESCEHRSTTWFSCAVTETQSDFSTVITTAESVELPYVTVTITATATATDAESTTSAATTTTSARPSSTVSSDSAAPTTTNSHADTQASSASSTSSTSSTATHNAAFPQATGLTAHWLVSGAGMALALAMA